MCQQRGYFLCPLQGTPQEQLKVPLRALPSGQMVRLVFPTSQVGRGAGTVLFQWPTLLHELCSGQVPGGRPLRWG